MIPSFDPDSFSSLLVVHRYPEDGASSRKGKVQFERERCRPKQLSVSL